MMRLKFLFVAILAGIAFAGVAAPARAGFELEYSVNGGTFVVIPGTGSGTIGSPYSAVAVVGNLTIVATGGGTTTQPSSSMNLSVGGTESALTTITIYVSMTGTQTSPPPEALVSSMGAGILTGSLLQTPGATITESDYLAQSNTFFDLSNPVVGPQTIPSATTINNSALVTLTAPYSWTLGMVLNNSANNYSTNNMSNTNTATLSTVPAPAGLVLLACGAPVLVGGTWWRRRKAPRAR